MDIDKGFKETWKAGEKKRGGMAKEAKYLKPVSFLLVSTPITSCCC